MRQKIVHATTEADLFLAGERVSPGIYRQIGGDREIRVDREEVLPASLDGKVACYLRVNAAWQIENKQHTARA